MTFSLEGILSTAAGLVCLVFWKPLGVLAYESQRRHFGVRSAPRIFQLAYLVAGLVFLTAGILVLAGALRIGK